MSLPHALLGVLEARPMTGYELTQFFDSSTGWVWSAPQSQIYPLLRQMERDGLIEGENQIRGSRLQRTVYSITEQGLDELRTWTATYHAPAPLREAFFLQALYFDSIDAEQAEAVLSSYIADQRTAAEAAQAHGERLLAKDTMLIKERLDRRPVDEHDRIVRLKANVFAGLAELARARAEWAEEELQLLHEPDRAAQRRSARRSAG
jgi:DNA-binding PadR family transcriptional regulator